MTQYVYKSIGINPVVVDDYVVTKDPGLEFKDQIQALDALMGISLNRYDDGVLKAKDTSMPATLTLDSSGNTVGIADPVSGGLIPYVFSWDSDLLLNKQRVFEKFNRLVDFTVVNAANTTVTQSSSVRGPFSVNALKFTASAVSGQSASATKNLKFNLNTQAGFWLLSDVSFRQTASQIGITLFASHAIDLGVGTGRFQFPNVVYSGAVSLQPIWVPKASWATLDGTPSFATDILSIRVRIDSTTVEARDWSICGAFTGGARPTVMITLDDGWDSSYTIAHAQAQKRGIPLTHYLIAPLLGAANYITYAQALEMRSSGDYLGLHGAARWDLDNANIDADVAALKALGIDTKHAAYPEGQIGAGETWRTTEARLASNGVLSARLAGGSTPTLRFVGDTLALTSYPLNNSMTLANAKLAVDAAVASGGTIIFYGHKFGAAADSLTWTTSDYTELLDYINQKRLDGAVDVTTIDKWYSGIKA